MRKHADPRANDQAIHRSRVMSRAGVCCTATSLDKQELATCPKSSCST